MLGLVPSRATLMIKPVGSACNLRCRYCYYLPVGEALYGGRTPRMGLGTLERVLSAWLPRADDTVTISWQGGEPTLAGRAFFERAVALQERYRRRGQRVYNALQTNGARLDDRWCGFFAEHRFLIGISIDGEPEQHDHYRVDPAGHGTSDAVWHGLELLKQHGIEHNILCVLNDRNLASPLRLYRRLIALGERWLQFIPAIEWVDAETGEPHDGKVEGEPVLATYSPDPEAYGRFLCEVFDYWFTHDRHEVSVRFFDHVMGVLIGRPAAECTHGPACHGQITLEHNGDVFGCDHYVQRRWQLGRVTDDTDTLAPSTVPLTVNGRAATEHGDWFDALDHAKLKTFADRKLHLPARCTDCRWRRLCYGGCPKHRPHRGEVAEPSVLCDGYQRFFAHSMSRFEWLAEHLRRGEPPPPPGRHDRGRPRPVAPPTAGLGGGAARAAKPRPKYRRRKRR